MAGSGNSTTTKKKLRELALMTDAEVPNYQFGAGHKTDSTADDKAASAMQIVKSGLSSSDAAVKAALASNNLRDFKNLTVTESASVPMATFEAAFRVGTAPLDGGYIALVRVNLVNDGGSSVTDRASAFATLNYTISGGSSATMNIKNHGFVVAFYENNALKKCHYVSNARLSFDLIALDTKIEQAQLSPGDMVSGDANNQIVIGSDEKLYVAPSTNGGGAPQQNSDWNATSGVTEILNKPLLASVATTGQYSSLLGTPDLAPVATTGSYNDLSDKPINVGTGQETPNTLVNGDTIVFDDFANDPLNRNIQGHVVIENLIDVSNTDAYIAQSGRIAVKKYESSEHIQGIVRTSIVQDPQRPWVNGVSAYLENFNLLSEEVLSKDTDNSLGLGDDGLLKVVMPTKTNASGEYDFSLAVTGSSWVNVYTKTTIPELDASMNASWVAAANSGSGFDRLVVNQGNIVAQNGKIRLLHAVIDCDHALTYGNAAVEIKIPNYIALIQSIYSSVPFPFIRRVPRASLVGVAGNGDSQSVAYTLSPTYNTPITYYWENNYADLIFQFGNILYLNRIAIYLDF